ncbi:MAG: (d)CMP kinase [Elusimicrobia bacterium]|nr:(d)CMP kinase [Elusimicrobiota bacterium]
MKDNCIITIDGPAGAGKTTIARMVADKLNFKYVDTGAMYRAVTLSVLNAGLKFTQVPEIEKLVENIKISIDFSEDGMLIYLDGKEISCEIRSSRVTENTSLVAAIPGVRYLLAGLQRKSASLFKKVVFEGRDMGSMVFPEAALKVYLDADIEERARRRWQEMNENGIEVDMEDLKEKIRKRDRLDESRGLAPLRVPENAFIIDSTSMTLEQVVEKIVNALDKEN